MSRKPVVYGERLYLRLDRSTRSALVETAAREGTTVSELLRQAARRVVREASSADERAAA